MNGIMIAHEFGHTQGLNHDNIAKDQSMRTSAFWPDFSRVKSSTDCGKFMRSFSQPCSTGICSYVLAPPTSAMTASPEVAIQGNPEVTTGAPTTQRDLDLSGITIEQLARAPFFDSLPLEAEEFYGPSDVQTLKELLVSSSPGIRAKKVLTLIGLITDGADADVETITKYIDDGGEAVSAASMALGYAAGRTGSRKALEALVTNVRSGNAARARAAVVGLGLSGHSDAESALQSARDLRNVDFKPGLVEEALAHNKAVRSKGLRRFYSEQASAPRVPTVLRSPAEPTGRPR